MKIKHFCLALGLTTIGLGLNSGSAQALDWNFSYTTNWGGGETESGSGIITTTDTTYNNQYDVTSLSINSINSKSGNLSFAFDNFSSAGIFFPSYIQVSSPNSTTLTGYSFFAANSSQSSFDFGRYWEFSETAKYNSNGDAGSFRDQDSGYNATLTATAVPWEFSPTTGSVIGVPLFIGLRMLKKRIKSKRTASKVPETVS